MEKRIAKTDMAIDFRIKGKEKNMISVAMATYNGARYITEQLESIYRQTKKVDELVIVDDCSSDDTVSLIREYMEKYPESNVRVFENETNLGYRGNFRKALSLCEGDVILLCDQDDIWHENKVEVLCSILMKNPEISVLSSSFKQIDGEGNGSDDNKSVYQRRMKPDELVCVPLEDVIFHNISQGCSMAIRKELKELYLKFYEDELPHDWMLNVIAAMQKKCYYINDPLFSYRIHDKNTIGLNDNMTLEKKNTWKVRANDALQAVKVLSLIKKVDTDFYHDNPWLEEMNTFARTHVRYLESKDLKGILFQNFNVYYKKLKTFRGRMLDIYFVLKK